MNMKVLFFVLGILLIFPVVSSAEIEMNSSFNLGDNLVAKVSGNFLEDIYLKDVKFYRRHLDTSFEEMRVLKIEDDFYVTAKIPSEKVEDEYSIEISGVKYMVGAETSEEKLVKNFTISSETSDFSVYPQVEIFNETFSIEIQNLNPSKIELNFVGNFETIDPLELKSGEIEEIEFNFDYDVDFEKINISSGDEEKIVLVYLGEGEREVVNVTVPDENDTGVEIQENVTEDVEKDDEIKKSDKTCSELNGTFCIVGNETCDGDVVDAQDVTCCLDKCVEKKENNMGKTLGWILIIVVVGFLAWFFKKRFKR